MKNTRCVLLLLVSLSAIATLSQGRLVAQDKAVEVQAAAAGSARPQDFFYDNPWIPDPVKQIAAPWVPYLGPIGYPPMTPAPPAAITCSPFLPPFLCASWGLPQPAPAPAPPVPTPASPSRPPAA